MPEIIDTPGGVLPRDRWRRLWIAVLLVIGTAVTLWVWHHGSEEQAIENLPAAQRQEVYSKELETFRTLCGRGLRADALEGECRERAEFLLQFPECDGGCQSAAKVHLQALPSR